MTESRPPEHRPSRAGDAERQGPKRSCAKVCAPGSTKWDGSQCVVDDVAVCGTGTEWVDTQCVIDPDYVLCAGGRCGSEAYPFEVPNDNEKSHKSSNQVGEIYVKCISPADDPLQMIKEATRRPTTSESSL